MAAGCGGCWLVVVVVVGVTPRIVQVDILAKVHKIQEFLGESDFEKTTQAKEHVFLHIILMRVLLA